MRFVCTYCTTSIIYRENVRMRQRERKRRHASRHISYITTRGTRYSVNKACNWLVCVCVCVGVGVCFVQPVYTSWLVWFWHDAEVVCVFYNCTVIYLVCSNAAQVETTTTTAHLHAPHACTWYIAQVMNTQTQHSEPQPELYAFTLFLMAIGNYDKTSAQVHIRQTLQNIDDTIIFQSRVNATLSCLWHCLNIVRC